MTDRRSLRELIASVRAKRGEQSSVNVGAQDHDRVVDAINDAYRTVWHAHQWPTLDTEYEIKLDKGVYLYSFPEVLSAEQIESVYIRWPDDPFQPTIELLRERVAPTQLYDERHMVQEYLGRPRGWGVLDEERFWVRPAPDGECRSIVMRGRRRFKSLVDPNDVCLVDAAAVAHRAVMLLADEDVEMRKHLALYDMALQQAKSALAPRGNISLVGDYGTTLNPGPIGRYPDGYW